MKWKLDLCNAHMTFNSLVYSNQHNEKLITFKNVLGLFKVIIAFKVITATIKNEHLLTMDGAGKSFILKK